MKVLIVYAHPNPNSFNHAILETAVETLRVNKHAARVKDLYAENFNPLLDRDMLASINQGVIPADILREQQDLSWAEGLIFIYPLWWFDRPAILKGWFDRVFTNGFAFRYTSKGVEGLLHHSRALVIVTTGGTVEEYGSLGEQEALVRPTTDGTLAACGVKQIVDKVFYAVPMVSDESRQEMLDEVSQLVAEF